MSKPGWIALWCLVVTLGIEIGAGIYEMRVAVPLWSAAPPETVLIYQEQEMAPDPGRRFWIFWTPLVGLMSLVNLPFAWRSAGPRRIWWIAGAALTLAVVVATFAYFVPVLLELQRAAELRPSAVRFMVRWWVGLNYVRAVVYVAAWLAALKAFSYGR